jgi:hypothetical protein
MSVWLPILAQPLAPDYIWFGLLLLIVLALMHGLASPGNRTAGVQHAPHYLHEAGHRLHELISHRHQ